MTPETSMWERGVHFYDTTLIMSCLSDQFDALASYSSMLRTKQIRYVGILYWLSMQLYRGTVIFPCRLISAQLRAQSVEFSINYSKRAIQLCLNRYNLEQEGEQRFTRMKGLTGSDALGWVSNDDELEKRKAVLYAIKAGLMTDPSFPF
jgi:hypothetical protein